MLTKRNIDIMDKMKIHRLVTLLVFLCVSFSCMTATEGTTDHTGPSAGEGQNQNIKAENSLNYEIDGLSADVSNSAPDKEAEITDGTVIVAETGPEAPLSGEGFIKAVLQMVPWNMVVVSAADSPLLIIHDLDKNGYDDALVVAVEGEKGEATLEDLSQSARLFLSGQEYHNFFLLIFYQYSGEIIPRYTVPVAKQLVFNNVETFEIKKGSDFPYSLLFSFRTRAGIEEELIILSGYGITRFTIKENLSEITLIDDIDDDGYKDIIVHEQGFEEGTGFETFLTWYKWNLREYTEYKSTNIVRNLREFFLVCAEYLRKGEVTAFLEYALDSDMLSELKKQGLSNAEILNMIFIPADGPENNTEYFNGGGFSTVVFPELMETPFSYAKRNDFRHRVSVRMGRYGEQSRIFIAELIMKKNPFQEKQFCFCINPDEQQ